MQEQGLIRAAIEKENVIKIITIGDASVGKSCIIRRFTEDMFDINMQNTIGVIDHFVKGLEINGIKYGLAIWDTAGQERFLTITRAYFNKAHGVMIVYDVTDKNTFKNVQSWIQQINNYASEDIRIILVGNKCDLYQQRAITYEQAYKFSKLKGVDFIEVSALSSSNIHLAYEILANKIISKRQKKQQTKQNKDRIYILEKKYHDQIKKIRKQAEKKSNCC